MLITELDIRNEIVCALFCLSFYKLGDKVFHRECNTANCFCYEAFLTDPYDLVKEKLL